MRANSPVRLPRAEAVTFLPRFEFRSSDRLVAVQVSGTRPRPTIPSNR